MDELTQAQRDEMAGFFRRYFTNGHELTGDDIAGDVDLIEPVIAGMLADERERIARTLEWKASQGRLRGGATAAVAFREAARIARVGAS